MSFDIPYNGNLKWLKKNTILFGIHGSMAYGTNVEGSDIDLKGVCCPPKEYFLGFNNIFEQAITKAPNPDMTIFDIRKFINLAAGANPNMLEILWLDNYLICDKFGQKLIDNRDAFMSKKIKYTLAGFAFDQLKRIKTHRRWLLNPVLDQPKRSDFKLPDVSLIPKNQLEAAHSQIKKILDSWELNFIEGVDDAGRIYIKEKMEEALVEINITKDNLWTHAARYLGYNDNFIQLLHKEYEFNNKKIDWEKYNIWKKERNPKRAELEAKFGYDCKHAMHIKRLYTMAEEVLLTGKLFVKRHDAEELIFIRNGGWTYNQLIEWAEYQEKRIAELYEISKLPHAPDKVFLDKLCIEIVEEHLAN